MKTLLLALFIGAGHSAFAGDVLIIDLNNSGEEVKHCQDGVIAKNKVKGSKDNVWVAGGGKQKVSPATIEALIKEKESKGLSIDSIIISGHDGSGEFFGENGSLLSSEMKGIVDRHPKLKASMTGMALWGCYDTTAHACQTYWMKNISPNIKATLGFTGQGPDNTRQENWDLLEDYCKKREDIANASTPAEMNAVFFGLKGINQLAAGICYGNGVCSQDYNLTNKDPNCFHRYDDLMRDCKNFEPTKAQLRKFEKYMAASAKDPDSEKYRRPPPDDISELKSMGLPGPFTQGELRPIYSQLHLWYHCAEILSRDQPGRAAYIMPDPLQVIRLTKFETVKRNFANVQQKELADYNARLKAAGLQEYNLEPARMDRQTIVAKTSGAVAALTKMGPGADQLLVMAKGFDRSLRELDPSCTPSSYVHDGASKHSDCVAAYGKDPIWLKR